MMTTTTTPTSTHARARAFGNGEGSGSGGVGGGGGATTVNGTTGGGGESGGSEGSGGNGGGCNGIGSQNDSNRAEAGITATTTAITTSSNANARGNNKNAIFTNGNNKITNNISTANNKSIGSNATDTGKRKKLKSRNAPGPNSNSNSGGNIGIGYSTDHLDAWLETCLKDAASAQLSSSSEFLDYNPSSVLAAATAAATTVTAAANNTKNLYGGQTPQDQQKQQQQQNLYNIMPTSSQQQQQQQFGIRQKSQAAMSSSSSSMPQTSGGLYRTSPPFSQGFQRGLPNFMKPPTGSYHTNNRCNLPFPYGSGGGGGGVGGIGMGGVGGFYYGNDGSQDFASLPPIVNMMSNGGIGGNGGGGGGMGAGLSELENNSMDILDSSGSNPNMARGFRFSDPCLLNPSDGESKPSGHNTPDRRNQLPSDMENNKFFAALMEQINMLHETNTKICRNLHETKVDIEALKHAPSWGLRHRRDSLSGLSTHSQPMAFGGGGFGTQSPVPTYHSGAYTPGMMTDVVREVKEAARVREDALLNRVKAMVEERQWSTNEFNLRMMRDIEELKSQVHHLRSERKETGKRLTHLEAENKYLRQMFATIFNSRQFGGSNTIYENETLPSARRSVQQTRRSNSMNLHYGTVHHQVPPSSLSLSLEEHEEPLHINETPSTSSTADIASVNTQRRPSELRNSFSSSDGGGGGLGGLDGRGGYSESDLAERKPISRQNGNASATPGGNFGQMPSPPNFALISPPAPAFDKSGNRVVTNTKDKSEGKLTGKCRQAMAEAEADADKNVPKSGEELQRELNNAIAARQKSDERVIALEKLVMKLQSFGAHTPNGNGDGTKTGDGGAGGDICVGGRNIVVDNTSRVAPVNASTTSTTTTTTTTHSFKWHQAQMNVNQQSSSSSSSSHIPNHRPNSPLHKLSLAGPITDL